MRAAGPPIVSTNGLLSSETDQVLARGRADVTAVVSQAARVESQSHYFKRETLYGLVWTAPVMEVAGRLSVSDVALAKLCRRANIPTPARGYWARTESGQQIPRPPLPAAPEGLPELLRIRGTRRDAAQADDVQSIAKYQVSQAA